MELEDDKTKKELLGAIREISTELYKIDEARDQIKEIIDATADAFNLPKPLVRKVAKLYHKKTAAQFEHEAEEIKSVYKQITLV
jgi:phage gpG-like protein